MGNSHITRARSSLNMVGNLHMVKLDKFELTAMIVATIGVVGGGVALFILASNV